MAPKISVTFLSSYLYCPRKLYFEQVLRIFKIPKEAVVKGTVRHESYEGINKAEEELVKSIRREESYQEVYDNYKKVYTKILRLIIIKNKDRLEQAGLDLSKTLENTLPLILDEAKTRALNVFNFAKKTNLYGEELWQRLTPKIESEVRVESDKLGLKGIIDEIRKYNDEIVPVELKTGKAPETGVWEGHKVQLGAYMMLLQEKNEVVKEGVVRYLDFDAERQIILDPFLEEQILDLINKVKVLLSQKTLPPRCEHKNKCKACQLYEECAK